MRPPRMSQPLSVAARPDATPTHRSQQSRLAQQGSPRQRHHHRPRRPRQRSGRCRRHRPYWLCPCLPHSSSRGRPGPTLRLSTQKPKTLLPPDQGSTGWNTRSAPESSMAMSPTLFPHAPCALTQLPTTAEGRDVTASPRAGQGTANGRLRCLQVRKRRPPQAAHLGYSTQISKLNAKPNKL